MSRDNMDLVPIIQPDVSENSVTKAHGALDDRLENRFSGGRRPADHI